MTVLVGVVWRVSCLRMDFGTYFAGAHTFSSGTSNGSTCRGTSHLMCRALTPMKQVCIGLLLAHKIKIIVFLRVRIARSYIEWMWGVELITRSCHALSLFGNNLHHLLCLKNISLPTSKMIPWFSIEVSTIAILLHTTRHHRAAGHWVLKFCSTSSHARWYDMWYVWWVYNYCYIIFIL